MNKKMSFYSKLLSVILILVFVVQIPISTNAKTLSEKFNQGNTETDGKAYSDWSSITYYDEVKKYYNQMNYKSAPAGSEILLSAKNLTENQDKLVGSFLGEENIIIWNEDKEYLTWKFDVQNTGLYQIKITYAAGEGTTDIVREISFDGKVPFEECKNITFLRQWERSQEIQKNSFGDDELSN